MHLRSPILVVAIIMILPACGRQPVKPVEDLGGGQNVSQFALTSLKGTRNGDRLDVQAIYSDGPRRIVVDLHFRVTPPPRLESGTWNGLANEGAVHERSSKFLGGQSGPPSIGGRFDLLSSDGQPLYRVTIPLQPLNQRI